MSYHHTTYPTPAPRLENVPPLPRLSVRTVPSTSPFEPSPITPTPADPAEAAKVWLDRAHAAWASGQYAAAESAAKIADVWQYRAERHGVREILPVLESRSCEEVVAELQERVLRNSGLAPASYGTPPGECAGGYRCSCEDASQVEETLPLAAVAADSDGAAFDAGPNAAYLAGVRVDPSADVVDLDVVVEQHGDRVDVVTVGASS